LVNRKKEIENKLNIKEEEKGKNKDILHKYSAVI
jgi:hypothetical protein